MKMTFKPAFLLMLGRVLGFGATFIVPLVLVRLFDQAEFGTYKQIFLIYTTLYAIAQFGMVESLFYFLPMTPHRGGNYVQNSLLVLVGSGLACFALLEVAAGRIGQWFGNPELLPHIGLMGAGLGLMLASSGLEIVMTTRQNYTLASIAYAVSEVLRTAFVLVPVLFHLRLRGLLLGAVVFGVVRLCVAIVYWRSEFQSGLRTDVNALRQQMAYALPFQMAVVLDILQANLPHYAVAYRFDAATFAIYSVGCLQIPLVNFLATSVGNILMVRMGEEIRQGRKDAVLALWQDTTRKLALIFFPLVALLVLCGREIIVLLFTESYARSAPMFMLWSSVIALSAFPTDAVMRVYADTRFMLALNIVRALLVASCVSWFLSSFDLLGAVLLAVVVTGLVKVLAVLRVKSLMQVEFVRMLSWGDLGTSLACAAMACVPGLLFKWHMQVPVLPLLLAVGFIYVIAYVGLLWRFGLFSPMELLRDRLALRQSPAEVVEIAEQGTP